MTSPQTLCQSCRVTKAFSHCHSCEGPLCKDCAQRVIALQVPFSELLPKEIQENTFCYACYDEKVLPVIEEHNQTVTKARDVRVIMKAFRGQVSIVKKARVGISVKGCEDKQEAIMKLAVQATKEGFNALVRTEIAGKKIIENGYQKTWWSASGVPAIVRESFSEDKYVAFDN